MRSVEANRHTSLQEALQDYGELSRLQKSVDDESRVREQPTLVSRYYDVVTRFYEFGWGSSFHFSPRRPGENLGAAQRRQQGGIAARLGLGPAMHVADIGCGVGGPLVNIGKLTGAHITGINFNAYQISRGKRMVRKAGLEGTCGFLLANFMELPLEDGSFDALYSFEAICHSPDKQRSYAELYRLVKPGGEIAIVDWSLTERFDAADAVHRDVRDRVERTNTTPNLLTETQLADAARAAGFEILEAVDQNTADGDPRTPWYMALQGRDSSLSSLARIPAGRRITAAVLTGLERVGLVPTGYTDAAEMLNVAADALVEAGELGLFTPSYLIHARKPPG